jgi:hypothetical protein
MPPEELLDIWGRLAEPTASADDDFGFAPGGFGFDDPPPGRRRPFRPARPRPAGSTSCESLTRSIWCAARPSG